MAIRRDLGVQALQGKGVLEYDKCDQLFPHLTVPAEANATSACRADVEGGSMYK